jgi:hypothetical protein
MAESSPPCDTCRHFDRCSAEPIACEAAAFFLRTGRNSPFAPRQPSSEIFERINAAPAQKSPEERERMRVAIRLRDLRHWVI